MNKNTVTNILLIICLVLTVYLVGTKSYAYAEHKTSIILCEEQQKIPVYKNQEITCITKEELEQQQNHPEITWKIPQWQ